jgi:hypothetical protein
VTSSTKLEVIKFIWSVRGAREKNNKTRNTIRNTSEQITRDKPIHKIEMDIALRAGLE